MAQIANITVKKYDGTTDIVYTALTGSAGDGKPAIWRSDTVSAIPNHRPTLRLSSKDNANQTTRIMSYEYDYPVIDSSSGVPVVVGHQRANGVVPVVQNLDNLQVREGIAQFCNLLYAALIKQSFQEGYAPRS